MFKEQDRARVLAQLQSWICDYLVGSVGSACADAVKKLTGYALIRGMDFDVHVITYGATEIRVPGHLIPKYGWTTVTDFILNYGDTAGTATLGERADRFGVQQLDEIEWEADV